jgi:hypothetical protein
MTSVVGVVVQGGSLCGWDASGGEIDVRQGVGMLAL